MIIIINIILSNAFENANVKIEFWANIYKTFLLYTFQRYVRLQLFLECWRCVFIHVSSVYFLYNWLSMSPFSENNIIDSSVLFTLKKTSTALQEILKCTASWKCFLIRELCVVGERVLSPWERQTVRRTQRRAAAALRKNQRTCRLTERP